MSNALYEYLVSVDHYRNIRRGIKVDQGCRIIKADQYNGVWDSDSLIVDHEEGWDNVVLFHIDADNTLMYTFGDSIQPDALPVFSDYRTQFKPASESKKVENNMDRGKDRLHNMFRRVGGWS